MSIHSAPVHILMPIPVTALRFTALSPCLCYGVSVLPLFSTREVMALVSNRLLSAFFRRSHHKEASDVWFELSPQRGWEDSDKGVRPTPAICRSCFTDMASEVWHITE